ncbi:MAG TPA: LuxR C-terminal-related transcriptional regulator, partial [Anaerolineae bacterium]|nr:LuxR C-terminal-related transcriptional regulator [Anaerolineae bacterium]
LGRRIQRTRTLLIVTYRDDELGPQHPLRSVLGDLATSPATRRITLAPLSVNAIRTLAAGRSLDPEALYHQTNGNPFFVTEVLAGETTGIPATIRDVVLARTARLSPSARAVLEAAAVIGVQVEPWLLADVTGAEIQAVDQCLAIGILLTQGDVLVFRHELARQTILDSILLHQRMVLHGLVLAALKSSPVARQDLARLAHHAEAAGDRAAVLEYAPAAARQAAAANTHRAAATLYSLALRFAAELPLDEQALLLEAYAQECDHIGQQSAGITARRKALNFWRELRNPLKQGENLAHLMNMLNRVGQTAEAEQVSHEAIQILETQPPSRELALAYRVQAAIFLVNRDCEEALLQAERALALAEQFQDAEILAWVHITIGTARLFLDYERGCTYLESKLSIAAAAGLDARVAHMYTNLGSGSGELYQFQQAERYLIDGIAYAAERDLDSFRLYMQAWQAVIYLYVGRWSDAATIAHQVIRSPGVTLISRITALLALGRLQARQGDPEADTTLAEALQLGLKADNLQRLGPVRAARAEAAWLAGDRDRALVEARSIYELSISKRHPWFAGELAYWRWRAGDNIATPAWLAAPFALQIAGDWRSAAEEWARLSCPYEQARALADGDFNAQVAALSIFERLGARPAADEVRQRLRASGATAIPRKPRSATRENPFALTERQVDILQLLIEDLSNADIAARLHISPKTVDHHVSAVLAKLDVHTREEAAALARTHPRFRQK